MNPPNMILHIIHPTKHPLTARPLTTHHRIMLRLMPIPILLTREPAGHRLRTPPVPTKQMLPVPIIMFPEVTPAPEDRLRRAARVRAPPGLVCVLDAVIREVFLVCGALRGRGERAR